MTGFRVALGGACELYALDPDLVTLGKIVGGGLPVGVFGGKRQFMDLLAPLGPVYQAGTLSGNPLAMAAGLATIGYLQEHAAEVYREARSHIPRRRSRALPRKPHKRQRSPHHQPRRRHVDMVLHGRARHELRTGREIRHGRLRALPPRHARSAASGSHLRSSRRRSSPTRTLTPTSRRRSPPRAKRLRPDRGLNRASRVQRHASTVTNRWLLA